jgi:hypothetical protein
MFNPFTYAWETTVFLIELFFSKKFILHRVTGLSYLLQFAASFYFYFKDYNFYYSSFLIWSLPLTGFLQSIIASYTFWFLPKVRLLLYQTLFLLLLLLIKLTNLLILYRNKKIQDIMVTNLLCLMHLLRKIFFFQDCYYFNACICTTLTDSIFRI